MSPNDRTDMALGALAVAAVILVVKFLLTLAVIVIAVITLGMTFAAFATWNRPRVILGETFTPQESRAFVGRGCWGAFIAFGIAKLYTVATHIQISENATALILLGGYAFAAIGIGLAIEKEKRDRAEEAQRQQVIEILPPAPPPPAPCAPFQYASWDDEDAQ